MNTGFGKFYQILLSKLNSDMLNKSFLIFFNAIFGKKITKITIEESSFIIPVNPSYLGHKSIINLNHYRNKNFNVHYWVNPQKIIKSFLIKLLDLYITLI